MLEHATFIFEVDLEMYDDIQKTNIHFEEFGLGKAHLRFTTCGGRLVVSGNVRAWRDYVKKHYQIYNYIEGCMISLVDDNESLFPEFHRDDFAQTMDAKFEQISVDDLTDKEKLIHCDLTVKFVTDRGISHEIVRHRIASFAQESTRYCNYTKDKFNNELTFIIPDFLEYGSEGFKIWREQMKQAEKAYFAMIAAGRTPQEARDVLPTSIKTELIMTANLNEWRHFFKLRAANSTGKTHPQMLEITQPLLDDVKKLIPNIFDDINY